MDIIMDHEMYEGVLWAVILGVSLVFVFYAYLLLRLAKLARNSQWKFGFRLAAAVSFMFGVLRVVVSLYYYEDPTVRLSIPITAAVSWLFIAGVGYATVRWVEQAAARIALSRRGIDLMNDVIEQAIEPLLKGEDTSRETVANLRARQQALITASH